MNPAGPGIFQKSGSRSRLFVDQISLFFSEDCISFIDVVFKMQDNPWSIPPRKSFRTEVVMGKQTNLKGRRIPNVDLPEFFTEENVDGKHVTQRAEESA
jgi:hypothetical protein